MYFENVNPRCLCEELSEMTVLSIKSGGWFIWANVGIKHGFPCINVCQVPREMLKTKELGRGF